MFALELRKNQKIGKMNNYQFIRMKKMIAGLLMIAASLNGQSVSGTLAELVYLQTDKQLYLAGELVYLKVFTVTPEKKPLSFSKIVYVEC